MNKVLMLMTALSALSALPLLAALPPLSNDDLYSLANHVITGEVVSVARVEGHERDGYRDDTFNIRISLTEPSSGSLRAGDIVVVTAFQAGARPSGWAGPSGQYDIPDVGQKGVFFLSAELALLNPNGWIAQ